MGLRLRVSVVGIGLLRSVVVVESGLEWARVLTGRKAARVKEAPFVMSQLAVEEGA